MSSSMIVTSAPVTVRPAVVPFTATVSSSSSTASFTGLNVNVASPLDRFAPIVSVKLDTAAKSELEALLPATVTVTTVSERRAPPFSVPVTVTVAEPLSATDKGDTLSVTVVDSESVSLSVTVTDEAITLL